MSAGPGAAVAGTSAPVEDVPGDSTALEGYVSVRPAEVVPRADPTWDNAVVVGHEVQGIRYHRLVLRAPTIARTALAGQFVMITVPAFLGDRILLPRPMAILRRDPDAGTIEVLFVAAGRGTIALARVEVGQALLLTGPLGRGFEIPDGATELLLMSHGSGLCAVMGVAEDARLLGIAVTIVSCAATRAEALGESDAHELGVRMLVATADDGSSDPAALAVALRALFDGSPPSAVMVCGSPALARTAVALAAAWDRPAQVSIEAHMACGLGYCHGCAAPVPSGDVEGPLVCRDGPVFDGHLPA